MKNPMKLIPLVILLVVLAVGIPYGIKQYRLNQMTETDLFSMGQVVANKGDCAKALDYYGTLLKKDPRHTVAMDFMAGCQIRLKDIQGATATLEKRNGLEPQPKSLELLAGLYDQAGAKDRAELTRAKLRTINAERDAQLQAQQALLTTQHPTGSHGPAGRPGTSQHQKPPGG